MRVLILGAGVIGASIAYWLTVAGAQVTLVDQSAPGGGTTSTSFAWLNANRKPPAPYQALNAQGIQAHRRLANDLGAGRWLHATGMLRGVPEAETDELTAHIAELQQSGYPAERIDPLQAKALEPAVAWPQGMAFAHFPQEGWAHGPLLVKALVTAVQARGAAVLRGDGVVALEMAGERVDGVRLASSTRLEADVTVIASGRWSDRVASLAGLRLPLAPTCGLLTVTEPLQRGPGSVVYAPGVHFRPDGDGRVVLQDDETDATVGPDTPPDPHLPGCIELLRRAAEYLPDLKGTEISEARVGIRALPADGYPIVGFVPQRGNLYVAVTHSGMTLGPLLGEIVADEISQGTRDARLATFRPDRCVVEDGPLAPP